MLLDAHVPDSPGQTCTDVQIRAVDRDLDRRPSGADFNVE
jgi:hypothetical protein